MQLEIFRPFTLGFDEVFDRLESLTKAPGKTAYPPYNIIRRSDQEFTVELAVAGFTEQDLDIEMAPNALTITGKLQEATETPTSYVYRGIANREFRRVFSVSDTIQIQGADLKDGMLRIYLENVIPEAQKARKITIGNTNKTKRLTGT